MQIATNENPAKRDKTWVPETLLSGTTTGFTDWHKKNLFPSLWGKVSEGQGIKTNCAAATTHNGHEQ